MAKTLTLEELVAATPQRQLYRARRGSEPWAVVVLPQALGSPVGWAERLRSLCERGVDLQAPGLALFSEAGSVSGYPALGRAWVEGTSARAFGRGKVDGLPPLLALLALVDLAVALDQLHGAHLFHGGIGPDAAIVDADGHLALVDAGIAPALSGKPGSEAADVRALGKLAYLWLTGREAELDPREPMPTDFALPSRLDRRVPAQVDPLMLRTLQAGGPRGLKQARELVTGLRLVLRSAGAAVSSADVAQWVSKSAQAARVEPLDEPLLAMGQVEWQPLTEKQAAGKLVMGEGAPRAAPHVATLVDMPVVAEAPPRAAPRGAPAMRPVTYADTAEESQASAVSTVTGLSSVSVAAVRPQRARKLTGPITTGALVVGVIVLGYALEERGGKGSGTAPAPAANQPAEPPSAIPKFKEAAPEPAAASGPARPPLAAYKPPPLPEYDPNAPPRPKAPPPRPERSAPHLGHGAWLSVESNRVARVFVDGHDLQVMTPVKRFPIAPGAHKVRLVAAMGADGSQEFDVKVKKGKTAYAFGKLDE